MGRIFVLDRERIDALLRSALVGRIACCAHDDDRPYLVPIPFGYDGESIYSISGPGRKLDIMRAQPSVAFEVDEAEAEDRWQSVMADGEFEEITDLKERRRAIEIVNPAAGTDAISPDAVVYRIRLTRLSGRFEVPDAEAARYEQAVAGR